MKLKRHRRQNQRGFALLLVFAMAAAAVVMLYLEMPRVAFEHERNKEALLVERGDQYVRAIQLYYKKYSKYPQTLEDLETTNNIRFLRRRYRDPMTGSDEWRLIHVDGTGQYTDSLIHKKNAQEDEKKGPSLLASNITGIGTSAEYTDQANGQSQSAAATTRRASDRIIPGAPGSTAGTGTTSQDPNAQDDPNNTSRSGSGSGTPPQPPGVPGGNPFASPQNGQPSGLTALPGNNNGQPITPGQGSSAQGQNGSSASSGSSGGGFGFGGGFGNSSSNSSSSSSSSQSASNSGSPFSNNRPGQTGSSNQNSFGGFGGSGGNATPNQAVSAIQNMLTNPNAATGAGTGQGNGLAAGAGGLVGVASKKDMEGILVYNERTNVKEWEFVFDQKKATAGLQGNGQQQQPGQQNQQNGSSSGFSFGGSSGSSGSSSSSSSGFGGSGSFGFGSSGSSSTGSSGSSSTGGFSFGGTGTPAPGSNGKQ